MPTKTVAAETMQIGKKNGGKHWTEAEVTARQEAAEKLKREKAAALKPPSWLSKRALAVWHEKIRQVAGLRSASELLDVLDTELLAVYCDAYVQYQDTATRKQKRPDDVKEMQAWSRILSAYGEKLGFTPSARARLVKKIADKKEDKFGSKFD